MGGSEAGLGFFKMLVAIGKVTLGNKERLFFEVVEAV